MSTPFDPLNSATAETTVRNPRHCVTPGCRHDVNERWDETGLLCADCVIEGDLFDRESRWDHVAEDLIRVFRADLRTFGAS